MALDALVQEVVDTYLETVEAQVPGLVEGLYLVGSVALGDFRPRTSDIDFVAVTTTRPDTVAVAALTLCRGVGGHRRDPAALAARAADHHRPATEGPADGRVEAGVVLARIRLGPVSRSAVVVGLA